MTVEKENSKKSESIKPQGNLEVADRILDFAPGGAGGPFTASSREITFQDNNGEKEDVRLQKRISQWLMEPWALVLEAHGLLCRSD